MHALLLVLPFGALLQEVKASDPREVGLTVYNGNFALVREVRSFALRKGTNLVRVEGVAARIDPTSVGLVPLEGPGAVAVREQNYQYDQVSPASILLRSVGKEVTISRPGRDGEREIVRGVLLSPDPAAVVLRTAEGVRTFTAAPNDLEVDELPAGLIPLPSLLWKLEAEAAGAHRVLLTYLTEAVNWKATYVALANADDTALDLTGWVTLDNQSGATYPEATLQLIAGDVRRIRPPAPGVEFDRALRLGMEAAAAPFQEEAFFEYHLYTLEGTTTVAEKETKQMTLLSAAGVPARKVLTYDAGRRAWWAWSRRMGGGFRPGEGQDTVTDVKVAVQMEIVNSKANQLGMPLPRGTIRVCKADKQGRAQFLGEDEIDHTPKDERVRLWIGDAFDVVGERRRTNYRKLSNRVWEETVEVELRNHKEEAVSVEVVERPIGDWTILEKSHEYEKKDAHTILFPVTVPKDGKVVVSYRIRVEV